MIRQRVRARLRVARGDERGIILPLAIMLLAVILTLTLVVVSSSVHSNTFANQQVAADQALATAETGVQTAFQRLNAWVAAEKELAEGHCFTTKEGEAPGASGCPSTEVSVGSNSALYYVEPLTSATKANCTGPAAIGGLVVQRCITATSKVGGVTRRVQERVVGQPETVASGIESLGKIHFNNTNGKTLNGNLYGNGEVEPGQGTVTGKIKGKPVGKSYKCSGCSAEEAEKVVNKGETPEVESGPVERRASAYESAAKAANNKADSAKFKEEAAKDSATYNEASRIFESSHQVGSAAAPLKLESGVYNFCEISFTQNTFLEVPSGAQVTIYVDSPGRPGSEKCASQGKVKATNGLCIQNASKRSSALKINVWGTPGGHELSEFAFTNNVGECEPLIANIYAPFTKILLTNGGSFTGEVYAGEVEATNGIEFGVSGTATGVDTWSAAAWTICKPTYSGTPSSGCY